MSRRDLLALAFALAVLAPGSARGQSSQEQTKEQPVRALLRMTADSGVVGAYRFTSSETHRLSFDIADDDPRTALLASATTPRSKTTEIAVTLVSFSKGPELDRRYLIYWLGYRITAEEERNLSAVQWDSIFQEVGRRAVLKISPLGEPLGVDVTSDAVRPVGQAFAMIVGALALDLPDDSVSVGSMWEGEVSVPLRRPDGTMTLAPIGVTYRLRELVQDPSGLVARIEFDGAPVADAESVTSGRYFGEALFDVIAGHFVEIMAIAEAEAEWPEDPNGLPPSRSRVEWQGRASRTGGD